VGPDCIRAAATERLRWAAGDDGRGSRVSAGTAIAEVAAPAVRIMLGTIHISVM
jgi:hypothetical protein